MTTKLSVFNMDSVLHGNVIKVISGRYALLIEAQDREPVVFR
jgi:hypothetical protein